MPSFATPGDFLFPESTHAPGPGTHLCAGSIVSSLAGSVKVEEARSSGKRPLVSVVRRTAANAESSSSSSLSAGDVVLCRVTRISQRAAFAAIICVERKSSASSSPTAIPLATPLTGILRAPDVRSTEIDAVEVPSCFRPGDVVRARVLSLGDARSFYLSTAADDLGVVFARSEAASVPLVAESWQQMRCPSTGTVEKRKVAKQQQ